MNDRPADPDDFRASLRGMIDVHTHLLPGIDDGARSMDEALALCRCAVDDGTSVVVLTPHSGARRERTTRSPGATLERQDVDEAKSVVQSALDEAGIPLQLLVGMEVRVDPHLLEQTSERPGSLTTLGASRYVLLEMPSQLVPPGMAELIFELQLAGYVPVIAHPERNLGIVERPERLYELVSRGCLAQVTAMSLTGAFGREVRSTAEALLEADLIHVIASDAHWFPERPTGLSSAATHAAALVGEAAALALVTTVPQALIEDRQLDAPPPRAPRRRHAWWFR